jgi:hypothetical protein
MDVALGVVQWFAAAVKHAVTVTVRFVTVDAAAAGAGGTKAGLSRF